MKAAKMAIISIVLCLGTLSLPVYARLDDTDAAYDLFENSRNEALETQVDDKDLDFDCTAKCTSMDPRNAPTCSDKYKTIESCLKGGCVWSCK